MPSEGQRLTDEIKLKIAFNEELSLTYFNNNSNSYEELRQEIRKICNFTQEQKFTIKWIDNEGDPCTISSQIEFEEAVRLYELTSDSQLNLHIFDNIPPPGKLCVGENKQIYRTATKSWRKVYKVNGHTLYVKRFNKKTYCICCSDRIWGLGRQGLKCIHCKVLVHKKCHKGLFIPCTTDSLLDIKQPLPRKIFFLGSSNALAVESKNQKHYSLEDFNLIKVIGRGSYAKVLMVELKETKRIYAMKVIRKDTLSSEEDMDWIQTEKHILELASNHPFLIGLHSCFQTELRLFFVVELAKGGDLMYHMQKKKKLPEFHVQFYAAEIILALNFLHNKNIIYRDLKLDNVLLDHDGHIKITDYGMSKEGITNDELTSTFCGTPNYIAPEIILGKDYGFSVDWWALGVLMFEMLSGRSPFISDHPDDAYEDFLFQVILERPIRIPRTLSVKAISILRGFLNKNPTERLGCVQPEGFLEIVNHPFFKTLDWEELKEKKIRPPYVPPQDILNFPCEFTKEPIEFSPDNHQFVNDKIDQSEFEGFDYVNPFLMSTEDYV